MPEVKISNWPSFLESPPNYYFFQAPIGDKDEKYNQTLYGFISYPLYDPIIITKEPKTFTKKTGAVITITIQQSSNFIFIKDIYNGYGFNINDIVLLQFYYKDILYYINSKVNSCTIPTINNQTQTVTITTIEDLVISNDKSDTVKTDDFKDIKISYQLTKYSKFVQNSNNSVRLSYYPTNLGGSVYLIPTSQEEIIADPVEEVIRLGSDLIPVTEFGDQYLHYAVKHPNAAATKLTKNKKQIYSLGKVVRLNKDLEINNVENNIPYKDVTINLNVKVKATRRTVKYKYNLNITGGESKTRYYDSGSGPDSGSYEEYTLTQEEIKLINFEEVFEDISKQLSESDATIKIKHTFTKKDYNKNEDGSDIPENVETKITFFDQTEIYGIYQLMNYFIDADFDYSGDYPVLKGYVKKYNYGKEVKLLLESYTVERDFDLQHQEDINIFTDNIYESPNLSFYTQTP